MAGLPLDPPLNSAAVPFSMAKDDSEVAMYLCTYGGEGWVSVVVIRASNDDQRPRVDQLFHSAVHTRPLRHRRREPEPRLVVRRHRHANLLSTCAVLVGQRHERTQNTPGLS